MRKARLPIRPQAAARQAHALSLAEAKVGSKWWRHLKVLNSTPGAMHAGPMYVALDALDAGR